MITITERVVIGISDRGCGAPLGFLLYSLRPFVLIKDSMTSLLMTWRYGVLSNGSAWVFKTVISSALGESGLSHQCAGVNLSTTLVLKKYR